LIGTSCPNYIYVERERERERGRDKNQSFSFFFFFFDLWTIFPPAINSLIPLKFVIIVFD